MSLLSLFTTEDGSHTIKNESTGDTYHSIHGAMQESMHVFLQNGLDYFLKTHPKQEIKILEIGFGTGLNALLTIQSYPSIKIEYTSLEPFPLLPEIYQELNYPEKEMLLSLHNCAWNKPVAISENFALIKQLATLEFASLPPHYFDVVYYDAFAPTSQPELWTTSTFEKVFDAMTQPAVLTTYCAKGQVKRNLKSVGFVIESLPGPPGKREMVRAVKLT